MTGDRSRRRHDRDPGAAPDGLAEAVAALDVEQLAAQRWFAGKARAVVGTSLVDALTPPRSEGAVLAVVDVAYRDGGVERYAMPLRVVDGRAVECRPADPLWPALAHLAAPEVAAGPGSGWLAEDASNTAVVLGGELIVKLYRRPLPGVHPEAELLGALKGTPSIPALHGALSLGDTTLLVVSELVDGSPVAWEPLIGRLASGDDAEGEAAAIAAVVGDLHRRLALALGSAPCGDGEAELLAADARARLDGAAAASPEVAELRPLLAERITAFSGLRGTALQRVHGDLHVGQVLSAAGGYVIVDWEGDPDMPLEERRRPSSPLRDLASLLLSFDHAACAAARRTERFDWRAWAAGARRDAIEAYESTAGPVDRDLLRAFEVDKELRELAYATQFVPEWLYAAQAVLPTLVR